MTQLVCLHAQCVGRFFAKGSWGAACLCHGENAKLHLVREKWLPDGSPTLLRDDNTYIVGKQPITGFIVKKITWIMCLSPHKSEFSSSEFRTNLLVIFCILLSSSPQRCMKQYYWQEQLILPVELQTHQVWFWSHIVAPKSPLFHTAHYLVC